MKQAFIILVIIIVLGAAGTGTYFFLAHKSLPPVIPGQQPATTTPGTLGQDGQAVSTTSETIGTSVENRAITAYHYGTGSDELLFVGGIHGGYEWNTSLVAYQLMDYLQAHPEAIPSNEKVTVIPELNPDGLAKVTGKDGRFSASDVPASDAATVPGRFNAHTVDLNRNFDCDWQATGTWQNTSVSGGTAAFSEPESLAIKNYVDAHVPKAVVVWYSAAGGVYSSSCHNGVSAETAALTKAYSDASGYPAHESFDFYATTGDMVNWLAKQNIPAISVLLTNHQDTEWSKNQAGVDALLARYAK